MRCHYYFISRNGYKLQHASRRDSFLIVLRLVIVMYTNLRVYYTGVCQSWKLQRELIWEYKKSKMEESNKKLEIYSKIIKKGIIWNESNIRKKRNLIW